jgi:hypothetical protein
MTTEKRTINALAPRVRQQGAAASLMATERKTAPKEQEEYGINPQESSPKPASGMQKTTSKQVTAGKVQIVALIPKELRGRARAAFRRTQFFERTPSFSAFVEKAIEAEVRRVEVTHNEGVTFAQDNENLPPGRPISL